MIDGARDQSRNCGNTFLRARGSVVWWAEVRLREEDRIGAGEGCYALFCGISIETNIGAESMSVGQIKIS